MKQGQGTTTGREKHWTDFKNFAKPVSLIQYEDYTFPSVGDAYRIWFNSDFDMFLSIIWKGVVPDGIIDSGYSQEQNDADKKDFETNYKSISNQVLQTRNADGASVSTITPRLGSEVIYTTPNYCDKTTWYYSSVRIQDETLTDSVDGLIWTSGNKFWVDMTHGKIFDEDTYASEIDHKYAVIVTVDGVTMTQRDPFATDGGDYDVDYQIGQITFFQSQSGKSILCSYSFAKESEWTIIPDRGFYIDMEKAKIQWSDDLKMNDCIDFEVWAYDPDDLPNKKRYALTTYKKMDNFLDEADAFFSHIAPAGGDIRGIQKNRYGITFRYGTIRRLLSSQGAELRIKLKNNIMFNGERATGTFFCTIHQE